MDYGLNAKNGIMFVNHQEKSRSGHLGHALVEYAPGCILAFYSNNSGVRWNGHNAFGWVEYKRSTDAGNTWSEPTVLDYSMEMLYEGVLTICCEKAVVNKNGDIVLYCLRVSTHSKCFEPIFSPVCLISKDQGKTWSNPIEVCDRAARVYDVITHNDDIYCLVEVGPFTGDIAYPAYLFYKSSDGGENYELISKLPFDVTIYDIDTYYDKFGLSKHFYGTLGWLKDGSLICYVYNESDEYTLEYCISKDFGITWSKVKTTQFAKRIRNPQMCTLNGVYYMHGRSGCIGKDMPSYFVLYRSDDGINWDDGEYIAKPENEGANGAFGYYSNNLQVQCEDGRKRILIQYSDPYFKARTNIKHFWLE